MDLLRRVCIVGSGPSGFYCAKYLLQSHPGVQVHMLERLLTPFGLVRSGVAPDHPEVKSVQADFSSLADYGAERFQWYGGVEVGASPSLAELRQHYDATVCAFGAATDRAMGVEGEDLDGVLSARAFVSWYNSHPEYRWVGPVVERALARNPKAVVIGQGNVALDCARILSKTAGELRATDMDASAAAVLAPHQPLPEVRVIGRRGPAQAAFTIKELRELTRLEGSACVVDPEDLAAGLNEASLSEVDGVRAKQRILKLLEDIGARKGFRPGPGPRKGFHPGPGPQKGFCRLHFLRTPLRILPGADGEAAAGVQVQRSVLAGAAGSQRAVPTGATETFDCGLVIKSIGYASLPIEGLPFDAERRTARHARGRCEPGLYAAGWLKRGPRGIIGTNIADAKETVARILEDAKDRRIGAEGALPTLPALRRDGVVSWDDWRTVDAAELAAGEAAGRARLKFADDAAIREALRRGA